jgi:hypothetical protein
MARRDTVAIAISALAAAVAGACALSRARATLDTDYEPSATTRAESAADPASAGETRRVRVPGTGTP